MARGSGARAAPATHDCASGRPLVALPDRGPLLPRLNPLAKLVAVMPAIVWVLVSESPAVSIGCALAAAAVLLGGARWPARRVFAGIVLVPAAVVVLSLAFSVWIDPARAENGGWTDGVVVLPGVFGTVTLSGVLVAAETALRVAAIAMLSVLAGAASTRTGLTDALMQNARVPYRIGYTAYAATGYPARLAEQQRIIVDAQRVRGGRRRRGPIARVSRSLHGAVALLIDALRHSERMALAIESRGFGMHERRTWRRIMPWRVGDTVYVAVAVGVTAAAWLAVGFAGC